MDEIMGFSQSEPHFFLVAAYGVEGIAAMALIADKESSLSGKRNSRTTYLNLGQITNTENLSAHLDGIVMVFILGSDDDITVPSSALSLALQCSERGIRCFTMLSISDPSGQLDTATQSLCGLSSNILLLPFTRPVDKLASCNLLKSAVTTIIDPVLILGFVGVDFDDIQFILEKGTKTHFSLAFASGENRATEAAEFAINRLPSIHDAAAILVTITCGPNFGLDEFSAIGERLEVVVDSSSFVVLCTPLDPEKAGEIQLTLMCVMR